MIEQQQNPTLPIHGVIRRDYIFSSQLSFFGKREVIGFGETDFYIQEIPKAKSKELIIKNHYSHKVCNDATTHIHFGMMYKMKLINYEITTKKSSRSIV